MKHFQDLLPVVTGPAAYTYIYTYNYLHEHKLYIPPLPGANETLRCEQGLEGVAELLGRRRTETSFSPGGRRGTGQRRLHPTQLRPDQRNRLTLVCSEEINVEQHTDESHCYG